MRYTILILFFVGLVARSSAQSWVAPATPFYQPFYGLAPERIFMFPYGKHWASPSGKPDSARMAWEVNRPWFKDNGGTWRRFVTSLDGLQLVTEGGNSTDRDINMNSQWGTPAQSIRLITSASGLPHISIARASEFIRMGMDSTVFPSLAFLQFATPTARIRLGGFENAPTSQFAFNWALGAGNGYADRQIFFQNGTVQGAPATAPDQFITRQQMTDTLGVRAEQSIKDQFSVAQDASFWINGQGRVDNAFRIATSNIPSAPFHVGTLPSHLNQSGYFEGTIRVDKGIAPDDAITLAQYRDSGIYVNPRWFGAVPDDGVSDRLAIQAAIDYASGRLRVGFDGMGQYDIDSTLLAGSGTYIDGGHAKIYLMDGSDCHMISNRNKTTAADRVIKDSMITIVGGQWYGNGDAQIKWMPDGSNVCGFWFSGVKNVRLAPRKIYNTQTYAMEITNCENVIVENVEVDQGAIYAPPLHNQDGVHFDGPAKNIIVRNCIMRTWDDCVAICTEAVPVGPYVFDGAIDGVIIDNIIFNGTRKGIRLLSGDSALTNVLVSNITGTAIDNVFEASSYGLGPGAFGNIALDNVNVTMTGAILNNEYISFEHKIKSVTLSNIRRIADNSLRTSLKIKPAADIGTFEIRGMQVQSSDALNLVDVLSQSGAKVGRMIVDGYHFVNGKVGNSTAIAFNGTTFNTLEIKNSSFDTLATAVSISACSMKQLRLSDNNGYKLDKAVFINASPVTDTLHLYGSVMVDTSNNAFITAGAANIGRIKSYLPTVSVPGSQAAFAPIRYSYSSSQYTLNPVNTIDLQTVTNANGVTTNMMKVTGVTNIRNGNGLELFAQSGIGNLWSYDRGGTNTLQPLLVAGTPVMLNTRALVGVNTTATDDGSTTLQVKGSMSLAQVSTSGNLTLTQAHHFVKITNSAHAITLPAAASATPGRVYWILNTAASPATISSVLVWGTPTTTIPANTSWGIYSDGTNWIASSVTSNQSSASPSGFVTASDADYTVTATDKYILLPAATALRTLTLPSSGTAGRELFIRCAANGSSQWQTGTTGFVNCGQIGTPPFGAPQQQLGSNTSYHLVWSGSQWHCFSN